MIGKVKGWYFHHQVANYARMITDSTFSIDNSVL